MAFPYMMYLASVGGCSSPSHTGSDPLTNTTDVALGIATIYYDSGMRMDSVTETNITTGYYSICLSLNILLTLMIIIRLMVHIKNTRNATGASDGSSGLHTAVSAAVMMLIESYALYACVLLAITVTWAMSNWVGTIFSGVIGAVQVRVVFTILNAILGIAV